MSNLKLNVKVRTGRHNPGTEIEAELYGPSAENKHLVVGRHDLEKAFIEVGYSMLIDLNIDGKESAPVIIREIQRDPLKNFVTHADFMQVDMDKKVTVPVDFTPHGKSNAITNLGGMLEKNLARVKIVCKPDHLVKSLAVDLEKLVSLKSVIRVEDLEVPEGITIKTNPRDVVYSLAASRRSKSVEAKGDAGKTPAAGKAKAPAAAKAAPAKAPAKKK